MHNRGRNFWHLMAIITMIFWGTSFVSTKILLDYGFSSIFIFVVRFIFTYFLLLVLSHDMMFSQNKKDEFQLFLGGLMGGTLYFWLENTALSHSPSSNVSLLVCTSPLIILIIVSLIFKKEKLKKRQVAGSLLTFLGMVLVVLNGHFYLKLSPKGDLLALGASLVWVIYSISVKRLHKKYSTLFITRKVFFYSCLTAIPLLPLDDAVIPWENFLIPSVIINFLLLTLFSSLFGYLVWNLVQRELGAVLASNYIYSMPLITIITAVIVLDEQVTWIALIGAFAIVTGMVLAEYNGKKEQHRDYNLQERYHVLTEYNGKKKQRQNYNLKKRNHVLAEYTGKKKPMSEKV